MMGVVIVKAAQHHLAHIRHAVSVRVSQQHQMIALRDINAFRRELERKRKVQAPRKNRLFIRQPITIRVLENQNFIVRLWITGTPLRITRHRRNPKPTLRVETDFARLRKIRKPFLRSK